MRTSNAANVTTVQQANKTDALQVGLDYLKDVEAHICFKGESIKDDFQREEYEGDMAQFLCLAWLQLGTALEIRQVAAQLARLNAASDARQAAGLLAALHADPATVGQIRPEQTEQG